MASLLEGIPGDAHQQGSGSGHCFFALRMGGLGIRSASWLAPAAFWASWAENCPCWRSVAVGITTILEGEQVGGCLGELQLATRVLDRRGVVSHLDWFVLQSGARPRQQHMSNLASGRMVGSTSQTVVVAQSCATDQAHLRSHSGAGAATSCVDVPQHLNSRLHPWCFGRLCARGCGCLFC